jgi:hypothetical protein
MTTLFDLDTLAVPRQPQVLAVAAAAESRGWDAQAACEFVLDYLRRHGPTASEAIVDAAVDAGHKPHDSRAFGYVFRVLASEGRIAKCGFATRRNGNVCSMWRMGGEA